MSAILTLLHSVTPKLTPVTAKLTPVIAQRIGILPDPSQVSVPSFKLIALKPYVTPTLMASDPTIDPSEPKK